MATAPTLIGPVGTRQINRNFYVGMADLTTIQKAVTVAVAIGSGCVIIPAGYAGSDTIASITGGNASVYLSDQRTAQAQNYVWSGSAYTPADFVQAQGYVTKGMPTVPQGSAALSYNPAGTTGIGTATLYIAAMPGMGIPSFNLTGMSSNGTGNQTYLRAEISPAGAVPVAGIPQIEMPSQLGLFNDGFNHYNLWAGMAYLPGGKGMTIWAKPTENAIDLQGSTIGGAYDQTIRLNHLGGVVQIGPISFSAIGDIAGVGDLAVSSIAADDADFGTCEVNNSPVRTFANTPDGPGEGMVWPPDGIPVSLGDHWQNPSIDPASLATWPAAGIAVSTGTAWGTPINPASLATYPPAGIPVSTGTAWGTSVDTANVAMRNLANIFTQPNSFSFNANGSTTVTVQGGLQIAWNVGNGSGETDFINIHSAVGGGFNWYNVAPGATLTSATPKAMYLDSANTLRVYGDIGSSNSIRSTGTSITAATPSSVWMDFTSGWGRIVTVGPSAGVLAGLSINGIDGASAGFKQFAAFGTDGAGNASVTTGRLLATVSADITGTMTAGGGISVKGNSATATGVTNLGFVSDIATLDSFGSAGGRGSFRFRIGSAGAANLINAVVIDTNGNSTLYGTTALSVLNVVDNADTGTIGTGWFLQPNIAVNNNTGIFVGQSNAAFNIIQFSLGFHGAGAATNRGLLGFIGGGQAQFDNSGNWTFAGSITAAGKSFNIPHPLDPTKRLVHGCIEAPEWGVYYRGEGATSGGWAEVMLPDYFEALVREDDRSVLLTPLFEDEAEQVGMMAASRVKDGKFKVWSALPAQKFYWEVKAVRGDLDPLEVEPLKPNTPEFTSKLPSNSPIIPPEEEHYDGNGTTEDGEPDTSDSRDATATTTGTARTRRVH